MKKYLVIGNPVEHSLSPQLHNYWINKNNIDAVYDKRQLNEIDIKGIIDEVKNGKIDGLNVTVPFKKSVIPFLEKLSPEANETQSVNTITYDNGDLVGHNTDIAGFDTAIKKLDFRIKDKKVLILGAGGVVPSIIFALKNMHVQEITISNRTREKAENLNFGLITLSKQKCSLRENLKWTIAIAIPGLRSLNRALESAQDA